MKRQLLFVDDDAFMLAAMRRMLRKSRDVWNVEFADSGQRALELLSGRAFDAVITDMRMPGMTGLELLAEVRQRFPTMKRIVLSGQTDLLPDDQSDVADAWLPKPCDPTMLRETIEDLCQDLHHPQETSL